METPGMKMLSLDNPQPQHLLHRHFLGRRLREELRICSTGLRRIRQARARRRKAEAMAGPSESQKARRERTRRLIEYGGLVVKAGLAELLEDNRTMLYGGFLTLCAQLGEHADPPPASVKELWERRGRRAFDEARALKEKTGDRKGIDPGST